MKTQRLISFVLILIFVRLGLVGCEPPVSAYRRSGLKPGLFSETATHPLGQGKVEVTGSGAHERVFTETPSMLDPALHVAETTLHGQARVGVTDHIAVGAQVEGTSDALTVPSADGTPPLRDSLALGAGPLVSVSAGRFGGLSTTLALSGMFMKLPWATWSLDPGEADRCPPCEGPPPAYSLVDHGKDLLFLYRVSITTAYDFNPYFGVYGGLSVQNSVTNIGFDRVSRDGSTLEASDIALVPYYGLIAHSDSGLFLKLSGFNSNSIVPGVQGTLGVEL